MSQRKRAIVRTNCQKMKRKMKIMYILKEMESSSSKKAATAKINNKLTTKKVKRKHQ